MELAYIDYLSNSGQGYLHKASVISKVMLSASIILFIIIAKNIISLFGMSMLLFILFISNKIPLKKIIKLSIYAAFFSLLFAIVKFTHSIEDGFIIIFKAVNSALAMLLLITTTPYPKVFSFIGLFLPNIVADAMLFTYRIFFILIEKLQKALTIIKIRGGFRPSNIIFNIKNLAGVIGIIFINAFDMSERMYGIYSLRGYQDKIFLSYSLYKLNKNDYVPIIISILILIMAVVL